MDEPKKLHPIIWVAGISVTVLSIAGVGAILGLIPNVGGKNAEPVPPPAVTQAAPAQPAAVVPSAAAPVASVVPETPAAEVKPAPVEKAVPAKVHKVVKAKKDTTQVAQAPGPDAAVPPPGTLYPPQTAPAAPPPCHSCGVVENIRAVKVKGDGSGIGMVAGGVLGGVLGHQVGGGTGRDLATIAGAVAGGYAGNEVEKSQRSKTEYEVVVRMEGGATQTFKETNTPPWVIGQQIRVVNGALQPR